jgi:hypothetical protein
MEYDMRGFYVTYKGLKYTCISIVETSFKTLIRNGFIFKDAFFIKMLVINPYGHLDFLTDVSDSFTFSEERN